MHVTRQPLPPLKAAERIELRPNFRELIKSGLGMLETWYQRYRTRRQLLALNNRMLQDIGISRADALREGRKPFWEK